MANVSISSIYIYSVYVIRAKKKKKKTYLGGKLSKKITHNNLIFNNMCVII